MQKRQQRQRAVSEFFGAASLAWPGYEDRWRADGTKAAVFQIGDQAYLYWLEVRPGLRGRGLGTATLTAICAEADRRGVSLGVLPLGDDDAGTARLRAWYGRFGFADLPPNRYGQVGMLRPARAGGGGA